jgi:hypothetical protein
VKNIIKRHIDKKICKETAAKRDRKVIEDKQQATMKLYLHPKISPVPSLAFARRQMDLDHTSQIAPDKEWVMPAISSYPASSSSCSNPVLKLL